VFPKLSGVAAPAGTFAANDWAPVRKRLDPLVEVIAGNVAPVLDGCIASAILPPQPVLPRPVGIEDCHCPAWSECENRALGSIELLAVL
jgi:hypothetical protein